MKLKVLLENLDKKGKYWRKEGKSGFIRRIYEINPEDITDKDKERFMSFVHKQGKGKKAHWLWRGWVSKHPSKEKRYGMFSFKGGREKSVDVRATRFSYVMYYGKKIPEGMVLNHICGEAQCVSPHHLYIGTEEENIIDRHYPEQQKSIKELLAKNYQL